MQVPKAPSPSTSKSGQPISYASAFSPSETSLIRSYIGFSAPPVGSLLQGQVREPITKAPKHKQPPKGTSKKSRATTKKKTDDNRDEIDPEVDEFQDAQVLEEAVGMSEEEQANKELAAAETTEAIEEATNNLADPVQSSPLPPHRLRRAILSRPEVLVH